MKHSLPKAVGWWEESSEVFLGVETNIETSEHAGQRSIFYGTGPIDSLSIHHNSSSNPSSIEPAVDPSLIDILRDTDDYLTSDNFALAHSELFCETATLGSDTYRNLFDLVYGDYSLASTKFDLQIDRISPESEFDAVVLEDIRNSAKKALLERRSHYTNFLDSFKDLISEEEFQNLHDDLVLSYELDKRRTSSIKQRLKAVAKSFSIRNQASDKRVAIRAQKKVIFKHVDDEDLVK